MLKPLINVRNIINQTRPIKRDINRVNLISTRIKSSLLRKNKFKRDSISKFKFLQSKRDQQIRRKEREDFVNVFTFSSEARDTILDYFDSFDIHVLAKWIYKLSKRQSTILMNTMMDCDGCWSNMTYVSKRFELAKQFSDIVNFFGPSPQCPHGINRNPSDLLLGCLG